MLPPIRTATVLVVEDDPELRELYRKALLASRHRVETVGDGLSALSFIDRQLPDVVVLDLGLPRVSGWDVYRDLRSRPATQALPIIIVTGNNLRDIRPEDLASFLIKPVEPEAIAWSVDNALRGSRRPQTP